MYDLSWLNPTPRAIAVYASQPLSPAATQHSLPSGRYSLLGPDSHRLDRTSFVLAHLFDHLVSAREQRRRDGKAERLGSLQVYHELDFHRLLDRQVGGLFAPEDPTGIVSDLTVRIRQAASIAHQPASRGKLAQIVNRRNRMTRRRRNK